MDTDLLARVRNLLSTTPSRREINRSLSGLAVGTVFAAPITAGGIAAKKKKKSGHLQKWKRICRVLDYLWCPVEGVHKYCCWQDRQYPAICTPCGCCGADESCCLGGVERTCCAAGETCCPGPNGEAYCCGAEEMCCGGVCVPTDYQSCGGVYCCHRFLTCCPDNQSCCFNPLNCPCSA
jgi:hypothetical protein